MDPISAFTFILIANNNITSVILESKTTGVKSLKYFALFSENIFKANKVLGKENEILVF